jgi:nitrile hydratase beta subunit
MNGVHDMGGMDGFGKVEPEPNEPAFHAKWEGRVMAMVRAIGAHAGLNIDASRFAREILPPDVYLSSSYYKKWLLAFENQIVGRGLLGHDEVDAGHSLRDNPPLKRGTFTVGDVARFMVRGNYGRDAVAPALFKAGDKVRARNINPAGHTRLPRYVRGHTGVVERNHGCHVFPDTTAHDKGENPQWLYTVVFDNRELWGDDADPTVKVSVEAFESYLELAS